MKPKTIAFIALMSTLGNVLFIVSQFAVPISFGITLDFSLIPALIAGIYGGPLVGFVTGFFVGVMPGVFYGPLGHGSWLGLIGLPVGKALTGLTSGFISKTFNLKARRHASLLTVPAVLVSYVPECLFTVAYFSLLMPLFLQKQLAFAIIWTILLKAWGEVGIMSILMGSLVGNHGFTSFINKYLSFKVPFLRKTES